MNARKILFLAAAVIPCAMMCACVKPEPEPSDDPQEVTKDPMIELIAPSQDAEIVLSEDSSVSFEWKKAEGINNYKFAMSLSQSMSDAYTIAALSIPLTFTGEEFDAAVASLGVEGEATADIYWSIIPFSDRNKAETQVRKMTVTRLKAPEKEVRKNAETIVVKLAIVYEDLMVTSEGKPLHECCRWADPHKQVKEMIKYMNEASHGVVEFTIAKEFEADQPFGYYYEEKDDPLGNHHMVGEYVTADLCYNAFYKKGSYPGLYEGVRYDYTAMIQHYGIDKLVNDKEVDELWVYNHPGAGMFEQCMAGPGAFWINGDIFEVPGLQRKLSVLFCNYERTVDLAMHSIAHRVENVMKKVYGGRWAYTVSSEKNLNNWERFSAYNQVYDKYDKGCSHIGNCHFPCNATSDYSYESRAYVKSYCDAWDNYPDMVFDNPRTINSNEWGNSQLGYMKWFYSHLPHFEGLNTDPNDYHLNNWWHYIVDWDGAMKLEKKLISEIY